MSYENALVLLDLASFVSANRTGVTYRQIEEQLRIDRRQAQRLVGYLPPPFPTFRGGSMPRGGAASSSRARSSAT